MAPDSERTVDSDELIARFFQRGGSERQIAAIADASPALIVVRDERSQIIWANRTFLEFHGTSLDAVVGQLAPAGEPSDARNRELRAVARVLETGEKLELRDERLPHAHGAARVFDTVHSPLKDESGRTHQVLSVAREVTDRARAEEALARSEAHLRTAQALARIGSWELHVPYRQDDYWSEETFRILGLDPSAKPPSPDEYMAKIVHPEDRERLTSVFEQIATSQAWVDQEYRIIHPDQSIHWVRIEARVERDPQGEIERIIGTIRDVTELKEAGAIRAKLEARLRQAEKLEAVGRLAGGIAHDFNNILGAIRGYTEMALDVTRDNPKAQDDLGLVLQAAERAADLVSNLLAFSRQGRPRRERLRLESPIRETLQLLRSTLPADVTLRESYDPATPEIAADPTQMLQVLLNLASNAVQAMASGGGVLSMSLAPCAVSASQARANPDLKEGLYALLTLSDSGCGIEPPLLGRVLEPFFTTKPAGMGTGLGLSVVHGVVREHGGALELQSQPGHGTTVRAYFPQATAAADESVAAEGREDIPRGNGQRVLVVEDDVVLAELERRRLESLGYVATTFTDAREALEALQRRPAEFDLLLTDHAMPHLTGLELAQGAHAVRPDLPVLLVSGYGEVVPAERLEAAHVHGLLRKPVARRTLAEAVAAALRNTPATSS